MRPDILPGNVLGTKQASGISKAALKVAGYTLCVSGKAISLVSPLHQLGGGGVSRQRMEAEIAPAAGAPCFVVSLSALTP